MFSDLDHVEWRSAAEVRSRWREQRHVQLRFLSSITAGNLVKREKVFVSGRFFSSLRLNLFGYLSAEFIIGKLSRVCKPLREFILSSQSFWKYRYGQRVRSTYRRVPINDESWLHVSHELERKGHEWQRCGEQRHTILSLSGPHIGPINDTILLDVKLSAREKFLFRSIFVFRTVIPASLGVVILRSAVGIWDDCCGRKKRPRRMPSARRTSSNERTTLSRWPTIVFLRDWPKPFDRLALDLVVGQSRPCHFQYVVQFRNSSVGFEPRYEWNLSNQVRIDRIRTEVFQIVPFRIRSTFAMTHRLNQAMLYAGVYDGHLNVYDTRVNHADNSTTVHSERVTRRGYIYALELQDPYVLVMHKSTTLCLYDQRTWRKIENFPVSHRIGGEEFETDVFPSELWKPAESN